MVQHLGRWLAVLACLVRLLHADVNDETCWCGGFDLRVVSFRGGLWRTGGYNGDRSMGDANNSVPENASVCKSDQEYSNVMQHYDGHAWVSLLEACLTPFQSSGCTSDGSASPVCSNVFLPSSGMCVECHAGTDVRITQATMGDVDHAAQWCGKTPSWTPRHSFGFVAFNDKLWIIGGRDASSTRADVWYSSTGHANAWTLAIAVAAHGPREGFAVIVLSGQMLLLGGSDDNDLLKSDVWTSADGTTWTLVTGDAQWSGRRDFAVTTLGDRLWLAGGYDGAPCSDVWSSSNTGVSWQRATEAASWGSRAGPGFVGFASELWVLGGYRYLPIRSIEPRPYQRHWSPASSILEISYPSRRLAMSDISLSGGSGTAVLVSSVQPAGYAATRGLKAGDRLVSVGADTSAFQLLAKGGLVSAPAGPLKLGFIDPQSTRPAPGIDWFIDYAGTYSVDIWRSPDGVHWNRSSDHTWTGLTGCKDAFAALVEESGPQIKEQRLIVIGATGERLYETSPVYLT